MILGIDPGSHHLGIGLLDLSGRYIISDCLHQNTGTLRCRMEMLYNLFSVIIDGWEKEYGEIEYCVMENVFYYKYPKATIVLAEMRGLILSIAFQKRWQIFEPAPTQIKKAVLKGKASKQQVRYMVNQILGTIVEDENESDALACAYWGVHHKVV